MSDPEIAAERDVADEIVTDLLRSSWIIERARASVYEGWSASDDAYAERADLATRRAAIVEPLVLARRAKLDEALVEPHAAWMRHLAGDTGDAIPLGNLLMARLGAWVDGHAVGFFESGADEFVKLGEQENSTLAFPEQLPDPPPFEPLAPVEVEPPGKTIFRFAILADLHFGSERGEVMARAAIEDINASGAELTIQLGDLTDHGNRSEFEMAVRRLNDLQMPYATMMGNHDVFSLEEERLSGREYYPNAFGRDPDGVLLEHKGFRFAVLDSIEHASSPYAPFNLATGTFMEGPGGAIVRGSLSPPQHEILARVAEPGSPPAFVFLHHPPQPFVGFPPVLFGLRDADSGRLHATIDSGNVWGVFAGHTHRNARSRDFDGVPAQEVAIPRDFPYGYALVDVSAEGYAYRFVQLSDQALLRDASQYAGEIHRRYGLGTEEERGFVWKRPG